jgi:hypothetical protein
VANAGLGQPAILARHLGLPDLLRRHVRLGRVEGAANPDVKGMTVIASLLAGGEWVDDVNALQAGRVSREILGVAPAAASTVGTFLRAFTAGRYLARLHMSVSASPSWQAMAGRVGDPAEWP